MIFKRKTFYRREKKNVKPKIKNFIVKCGGRGCGCGECKVKSFLSFLCHFLRPRNRKMMTGPASALRSRPPVVLCAPIRIVYILLIWIVINVCCPDGVAVIVCDWERLSRVLIPFTAPLRLFFAKWTDWKKSKLGLKTLWHLIYPREWNNDCNSRCCRTTSSTVHVAVLESLCFVCWNVNYSDLTVYLYVLKKHVSVIRPNFLKQCKRGPQGYLVIFAFLEIKVCKFLLWIIWASDT